MINTASRIMMAAAAAGLAVAPVAAQANTRAGDSGSVYSVSASGPGLGRAAEGEFLNDGIAIIVALLAAAGIISGIVIAVDSGDDGQSPGT